MLKLVLCVHPKGYLKIQECNPILAVPPNAIINPKEAKNCTKKADCRWGRGASL